MTGNVRNNGLVKRCQVQSAVRIPYAMGSDLMHGDLSLILVSFLEEKYHELLLHGFKTQLMTNLTANLEFMG